eukprot:3069512-Alexandrium_andersonii.AAC.1
MHGYRQEVFHASPQVVSPIPAWSVQESFQGATVSAAGPDGWTVEHFRGAPAIVFVWLARMYVAIEEGRMRWPSVLLVSRAVMLPKTDKLSTDCMDH